jgi:hypothetical protein
MRNHNLKDDQISVNSGKNSSHGGGAGVKSKSRHIMILNNLKKRVKIIQEKKKFFCENNSKVKSLEILILG